MPVGLGFGTYLSFCQLALNVFSNLYKLIADFAALEFTTSCGLITHEKVLGNFVSFASLFRKYFPIDGSQWLIHFCGYKLFADSRGFLAFEGSVLFNILFLQIHGPALNLLGSLTFRWDWMLLAHWFIFLKLASRMKLSGTFGTWKECNFLLLRWIFQLWYGQKTDLIRHTKHAVHMAPIDF